MLTRSYFLRMKNRTFYLRTKLCTFRLAENWALHTKAFEIILLNPIIIYMSIYIDYQIFFFIVLLFAKDRFYQTLCSKGSFKKIVGKKCLKFLVKLTLRWRVVLYYIRNRVKKRLKQNKAEFSILGWSITKGCSLSLSKIMQSPEKISTVKKNNQCLNRILQEKHFWVYNGEEEYYPWSLLVNFA